MTEHRRIVAITGISIAVVCYLFIYLFLDTNVAGNTKLWKNELYNKASKFIVRLNNYTAQVNFTYREQWAESKSTEPESESLTKAMKDKLVERLAQATDKKIIIRWYAPWNDPYPVPLDPKVCGNCEVTYDRSKINDPNTGAIEFHYLEISPQSMPPLKTRNYSQLYVHSSWEGPPFMRGASHKTLEYEDSYGFNATLTYRRTADFYSPFGSLHEMDFLDNLDHILEMKTKTAIAVVSNCDLTRGAVLRKKILLEIRGSGFKLDAFGRCFESQLVRNDNGKFMDQLKAYKFYFAYENSYHCKDYMTEKYFRNALRSTAIPVVWGPPKYDYEAIAPKHSFISAEDFNSTKELTAYLSYLDKNDTAYLEYFRWRLLKPEDMPQFNRQTSFCSLCRAIYGINVDDFYNPKYNKSNLPRPLFTDGISQRIVPSVRKFFYEEGYEDCLKLNKK